MANAFGAKRVTVKPPERGIFPLDHDSQCKESMKKYLDCLSSNKYDHAVCRDQSKSYLKCRMDHDLMMKEDLGNLGLGEDVTSIGAHRIVKNEKKKESQGYLAGLDVRPSRTWF